MENIQKSLYIRLNECMESQLEKDRPDTELINECVDGMLRLMPESAYQITRKKREENIRRILERSPRRKTKAGVIKILIAAAIIMLLLIGAALAYTAVEYKIYDYGPFSDIWSGIIPKWIDKPVEVGYIPEGFELIEEKSDKVFSYKVFKKYEIYLTIQKDCVDAVMINTEFRAAHSEIIDGTEYVLYGEEKHGKGIFWANGNYNYSIAANLKDDELLKIAQSVR